MPVHQRTDVTVSKKLEFVVYYAIQVTRDTECFCRSINRLATLTFRYLRQTSTTTDTLIDS